MPAETGSSTRTVEVLVPLLNEGTDVWRPTQALILGPDEFQLLAAPDYDAATEQWQFPPGSRVECTKELRQGRELLLARQRVA
jgi:hypothetical protein